jgi:chemotaxis protein MotB
MTDEHAQAEAGVPEYMVSYADMLTIMLAFFVVLYSTTSVSGNKDKGGKSGEPPEGGKEPASAMGLTGREIGTEGGPETIDERLKKVFDSLYYRFGPDWTATNCWTGGPPELRGKGRPAMLPSRRPPGATRDDFSMLIMPKPSDNIVAGGRIYFDNATATLNAKQTEQLRQVATELAGKMQKLEIRGHTSRRPLPPNSPFRDHWDLAYARARSVEQYLVAAGIDPERLRLSVASHNEPLSSDRDLLKIAQDSRVEIRTLNEWVKRRGETPSPPAKNVNSVSSR